MAITTWAATTGDWDDSKFDRGWDGPAISPAVGSLSLSTTAPTVSLEIKLSVGNANLEIIQSYEWNQVSEAWEDVIGDWSSGPVPHVAIGDADSPAKADLTLTGSSAPKVGIEYKFPITVGELTATGSIPAIKEALQFVPAVGSMEIIQSYEWNQMSDTWDETSYTWETGPSPSVAIGTDISVDEADLTLTGSSAPSLKYYFNIKVDEADLTLTGSIPGWNLGKEFDVDNADLEVVQSYNWNTYGGTWADASGDWETAGSPFIPTAIEQGQNQPDKGDLTLTGIAPDVTKQQLWYIPTQDLTLSTTAPDAPIGPIFEPANADLTGSTSAPRAEETQHEGPAKADLTLTGQIPLASESHVRHVPVGETTLTGYIPLIGGNHFRTIGAGALTGLGTTSWDDTSGDWASASGTWGTGTLTPIPGVTYTFPIDSGDEFALTTFDPKWPLIRQPHYKPQVIMS